MYPTTRGPVIKPPPTFACGDSPHGPNKMRAMMEDHQQGLSKVPMSCLSVGETISQVDINHKIGICDQQDTPPSEAFVAAGQWHIKGQEL